MFSLRSYLLKLVNLVVRMLGEKIPFVSDGYHTFAELYESRLQYNASTFNAWSALGFYDVHKSKRHYDGEECFGGGWFIVVAILPTGQISNHYKLEDWELFSCKEEPRAKYPFDGHTADDVSRRLRHVNTLPKG